MPVHPRVRAQNDVVDGSGSYGRRFESAPSPVAPRPAPSAIVTNFAAGHGWTVTAAGQVNLNYTAESARGTQCMLVKTNANNADCIVDSGAVSLNMTGKSFRVLLKVSDATDLSRARFYAGDSGMTNYFQWNVVSSIANNRSVFPGEWTEVVLPFGTQSVTGTPNRAAIAKLRWAVRDTGVGQPTVLFQAIETTPASTLYPNGVVSISFDDNPLSQLSLAAPVMGIYGYTATSYIIVDQLGANGTQLTLAQCYDLQARGWEIAGHAYAATVHNMPNGFIDVSPEVLDLDLRNLRAWIGYNGFSDQLAYPHGTMSRAVINQSRQFFRGATSTEGNVGPVQPADPMRVSRVTNISSASGGTSPATIQTYIDRVAANGGWLNLNFHTITSGAASDPGSCSVADFTTIMAYVASKGVPVRNVGQVLAGY